MNGYISERIKENRGTILILLLLLAAALGLRLLLLLTSLSGVNADQAVPGLMGIHILKGYFPNFLWEYKYCGAFISYLAALNFKLFGISVLSFKLATFPLVAASILFTYAIGAEVYDRRTGLAAALLTALPPVFILLLGVSPHGTYAETLALGPALLYLSVLLRRLEAGRTAIVALLGFLAGFAFWISPLIIPYIAVVLWGLAVDSRSPSKKEWCIMAGLFLAGAFPLLVYNVQHPFATFLTLSGRPLDITRSSFSADLAGHGAALTAIKYLLHYISGLPRALAAAFTNACSVFWMADSYIGSWPARIAVCLLCLVPALYYAVRQRRAVLRDPFCRLVLAGLVFAFLGFLDSPRYLLPVWVGLSALFAAAVAGSGLPVALRTLLLSSALLLNLTGALSCLKTKTPPYGELVKYLDSEGLTRGYAGYWTAYPVTFLSREEIIVSPALDLHSVHPRSMDTYPFYTNIVDGAENVFYVLNDSAESTDAFEKKMKDRKTEYSKSLVPPFAVYHSFSRRCYPADLDLASRFLLVPEPFFY